MTTFGKDDLIAALRLRYDYYSAENVFHLARERAGLADKATFDAADLRVFRAALEAVGDRVKIVLAELDRWLEAAPAAAPSASSSASSSPAKPASASSRAAAQSSPPPAQPSPAAQAVPAAAPLETTIVLTGVPAADDEQVLVCGGYADLGDWDPTRARPMARKGDEWLTTVQLSPEAEVSFKFLRRTADGDVIWEDGENRNLVAAPRVVATWRAG